jgi:hypothetical protein
LVFEETACGDVDGVAEAVGGGVGVGEGSSFGKKFFNFGWNFEASSSEANSIAQRNCGSLGFAGQAANSIREVMTSSACALSQSTSVRNSFGGEENLINGSSSSLTPVERINWPTPRISP